MFEYCKLKQDWFFKDKPFSHIGQRDLSSTTFKISFCPICSKNKIVRLFCSNYQLGFVHTDFNLKLQHTSPIWPCTHLNEAIMELIKDTMSNQDSNPNSIDQKRQSLSPVHLLTTGHDVPHMICKLTLVMISTRHIIHICTYSICTYISVKGYGYFLLDTKHKFSQNYIKLTRFEDKDGRKLPLKC